MKVLLRKNVSNLGHIGQVVEVRRGYARNYLLPQGLAFEPSEANLKAVEAEKQEYLQQVAKERAELQARADLAEGKEVTISARANETGHLYGWVGPAQIAAALTAEGAFVDSEQVVIEDALRQLDKYDVTLRFAEDITATVHVWIVPAQEAPPEEGEEADAAGFEAAPQDDPGETSVEDEQQ